MRTQVLLGLLWIGACSQVSAADSAAIADLAKASGCFSCHSAKEKVVGPAFSSIAEKYAGDKDAVSTLTQSIQRGSQGKWGRIPMPAHPSLSNDELKSLASWVMSNKP